jgi:outer membrane receptor protein involved in Fe transport
MLTGRGLPRVSQFFKLMLGTLPFMLAANAQDADDQEQPSKPIDEIVTVGSQIKGAQISEALAVSVIQAAEIEALGVDSGDELLEFIAEQGQNYFSESENISGGVNSARGDIGAYNLRSLGTGNTLVLLNGRRLVNAASYQTEEVGGSFIPVNTVNSQTLPVTGLERVEVLRDGASAIYGADAVAGVVNYVMKSDFEGLTVRAKYADYEGLPRHDQTFTVEWGQDFNGGRSNVSVFGNYYGRDPVNSQDDPRWASDDFRDRIPLGSPFEGDTAFRNSSVNSEYGQFDFLPDGTPNINYGLSALGLTDADGEFHVYPVGDGECDWDLNAVVCGANDSGALISRYNNNENRDLYSDLERMNLFTFINHEFSNGVQSFTELSGYASDTTTIRQASTRLTAVAKYVVPAENYYNPFGPCGSINRLPDSVIGTGVPCEGLDLLIDNHRVLVPRVVDNKGDVVRILQGFRGTAGAWDWEGAVGWSRATREDITYNRISNIAFEAGLARTDPGAINLFSGRDNMNIEQTLITVRRDNETELTTADFRVSNNEMFDMPAGPVGIVGGVEYREESFVDDRDPRLDGQIEYIDGDGQGFPLVSDVMNSSPSLDSRGSRDVISAFAELQIPLFDNLDIQAAMRYEDFSDVGDTTVGKLAFGWRPIEPILLRGSWSEAFRVPNLITVNESGVARSNTTNDYVYLYVDPLQTLPELDGVYGIQRTAGGSDELVPEQSTNTSIGVVIDATPNLTFTLDFWSIEKDDTIGLFGEDNHTALDLLLLLEAGNSSCSASLGNPAVVRNDSSALSQEALDLFSAAGICPVGDAQRVEDVYQNLDTRKVSGQDVGIYFNVDTSAGEFYFVYNGSFLAEYKQVPGPGAQALLDAQASGVLPPTVVVEGFGSLVRKDANPREKHTVRMSWRRGDWGAAISGVKIGDVYQESLTLADGTRWILPTMTTFNASLDYRFDTFADSQARLRFGIVNLTDERAPLADDSFGYSGDMHRDMPRSYYVDLRLAF